MCDPVGLVVQVVPDLLGGHPRLVYLKYQERL
jgi:hypothetical protein